MAPMCFAVSRIRIASVGRLSCRHFSTPVVQKDIKKSVFISQSKDVYTNLALVDWLQRNFDFSNHHVLMLWGSQPSVTVGKRQNPWLEINLSDLQTATGTDGGIKLARRDSDSGSIYHDEGTLNMTFFTSREHHNSKYSLHLIRRALFREFELKTDVTQHGLQIHNEKHVSETSNKLGDTYAYQHCNLLVKANHKNKNLILHKNQEDIISSVIGPTKPKLMNLNDANRKITIKTLLRAVGWEYLRTEALKLRDGGEKLANQQKGFQMINPTENWFPGITEIRNHLQSWDWCYGATPTFNISRSFSLPEHLSNNLVFPNENLKITMVVEEGRISDVRVYIPPGLTANGFTGEANVITTLRGQKFTNEAFNSLEWSLGSLLNDKEKFVTDCVKQVMTSV